MGAIASERPPQDIQEARQQGVPEAMLRCPESGKPYRYDPGTGMVACETPGHENLSVRVPGGAAGGQ